MKAVAMCIVSQRLGSLYPQSAVSPCLILTLDPGIKCGQDIVEPFTTSWKGPISAAQAPNVTINFVGFAMPITLPSCEKEITSIIIPALSFDFSPEKYRPRKYKNHISLLAVAIPGLCNKTCKLSDSGIGARLDVIQTCAIDPAN